MPPNIALRRAFDVCFTVCCSYESDEGHRFEASSLSATLGLPHLMLALSESCESVKSRFVALTTCLMRLKEGGSSGDTIPNSGVVLGRGSSGDTIPNSAETGLRVRGSVLAL